MDIPATTFSYTDRDFQAQLSGGFITLAPDIFQDGASQAAQPVTVGITGQLCLRYDFVLNRLEFCTPPNQPFTVALQGLRLQLKELPGFAAAIDSAQLELSGTEFPRLKGLNGSLIFALPAGSRQSRGRNQRQPRHSAGSDSHPHRPCG